MSGLSWAAKAAILRKPQDVMPSSRQTIFNRIADPPGELQTGREALPRSGWREGPDVSRRLRRSERGLDGTGAEKGPGPVRNVGPPGVGLVPAGEDRVGHGPVGPD